MTHVMSKVAFMALLEFLPIISFVLAFEFFGFLFATHVMIVLVIVSTVALYLQEKKIPLFTLTVTAITVVFASASILLNNPGIFILRDSFYDFFFATMIAYGLARRKNILEKFFGHFVTTTPEIWKKLSILWLVYFLCVGTTNEYIRRTEIIDLWVMYKISVVGVTTAALLVSIVLVSLNKNRV